MLVKVRISLSISPPLSHQPPTSRRWLSVEHVQIQWTAGSSQNAPPSLSDYKLPPLTSTAAVQIEWVEDAFFTQNILLAIQTRWTLPKKRMNLECSPPVAQSLRGPGLIPTSTKHTLPLFTSQKAPPAQQPSRAHFLPAPQRVLSLLESWSLAPGPSHLRSP